MQTVALLISMFLGQSPDPLYVYYDSDNNVVQEIHLGRLPDWPLPQFYLVTHL